MERQHLRGFEAGRDVTELPRVRMNRPIWTMRTMAAPVCNGDDQVAQTPAAAGSAGRACPSRSSCGSGGAMRSAGSSPNPIGVAAQ